MANFQGRTVSFGEGMEREYLPSIFLVNILLKENNGALITMAMSPRGSLHFTTVFFFAERLGLWKCAVDFVLEGDDYFESAVGHMAQRNRWWFGKEFEICVSTPHNSSLAS